MRDRAARSSRLIVSLSSMLLAVAALHACGARDELDDDPERPLSRADAAGGERGSSGSGGTRSIAADAGTVREADATTPFDGSSDSAVRDADSNVADEAIADAPVDAPGDALLDVVSFADCSCPVDDYFIDARIGGDHVVLTAPFRQGILCEEEAVQFVHETCGLELYRLSACAGPGSARPCIYVALTAAGAVLDGYLIDSTGQTYYLEAGSIVPESIDGRLGTGVFSATFAGSTAASLDVSGSYRACIPRTAPCNP